MRGVMRYFELLAEKDGIDNCTFYDMRPSLNGLGLPDSKLKIIKKNVRKLCRELHFEEMISPADGSTRFRVPHNFDVDVCDPFDLMEMIFQDAMGISFEDYFKKNKVKKAKTVTKANTFEVPDHMAVVDYDEEGGKP